MLKLFAGRQRQMAAGVHKGLPVLAIQQCYRSCRSKNWNFEDLRLFDTFVHRHYTNIRHAVAFTKMLMPAGK